MDLDDTLFDTYSLTTIIDIFVFRDLDGFFRIAYIIQFLKRNNAFTAKSGTIKGKGDLDCHFLLVCSKFMITWHFLSIYQQFCIFFLYHLPAGKSVLCSDLQPIKFDFINDRQIFSWDDILASRFFISSCGMKDNFFSLICPELAERLTPASVNIASAFIFPFVCFYKCPCARIHFVLNVPGDLIIRNSDIMTIPVVLLAQYPPDHTLSQPVFFTAQFCMRSSILLNVF